MPVKGGTTGNNNAKKNEADNISLVLKDKEKKSSHGTSPSYIAKRLKRDNPELF